jgi:hypothetical protein
MPIGSKIRDNTQVLCSQNQILSYRPTFSIPRFQVEDHFGRIQRGESGDYVENDRESDSGWLHFSIEYFKGMVENPGSG